MKRSEGRILTTRVGSLPGTGRLIGLPRTRDDGGAVDRGIAAKTRESPVEGTAIASDRLF